MHMCKSPQKISPPKLAQQKRKAGMYEVILTHISLGIVRKMRIDYVRSLIMFQPSYDK